MERLGRKGEVGEKRGRGLGGGGGADREVWRRDTKRCIIIKHSFASQYGNILESKLSTYYPKCCKTDFGWTEAMGASQKKHAGLWLPTSRNE